MATKQVGNAFGICANVSEVKMAFGSGPMAGQRCCSFRLQARTCRQESMWVAYNRTRMCSVAECTGPCAKHKERQRQIAHRSNSCCSTNLPKAMLPRKAFLPSC